MSDSERLYDELLGLCYECVLNGSAWQDLLSRLAEATGRQQGALLFWNQRNTGGQVSNFYQLEQRAAEAYNSYYCDLDPTRFFMHDRAVGNWYHDLLELGPARIRRDPYYQEYKLPYGMKSVSCVKLHKQGDSEVFLSLVINKDARQPKEQQQKLLSRITPHLLKAAHLSDRLNNLELELAKRDLLLDQHPAPLWLADPDGHVVYSNGAAERRMSQPGFTLYQSFGSLHCKTQDARLQQLLRQAAGTDNPGRASWLRLAPAQAQVLLITPVPAAAPFNRFFQKPLVLLALLESRPQSDVLAELFQLTPAEQRLAELLGQGHTAEGCAERLGVSINTIRSQLRALFRKTDTTRQAELMNLIVRIGQR
ncbi:MAG: helix-turn-helix transcriptional regulator [Pseudomonas sp.]